MRGAGRPGRRSLGGVSAELIGNGAAARSATKPDAGKPSPATSTTVARAPRNMPLTALNRNGFLLR